MANAVNMPASQRKQWSSHKASVPFHRNGSYLAEDGCPDSQVLLAKQLLEENDPSDADYEENAQQGVYWLIKASKQGHSEATQLLKQCVESGRGISEHNYLDVRECLETPDDEKHAVKVARDIFSVLSADDDFITTDQLRTALKLAERVTEGLSEETSKKLIQDLLTGSIGQDFRFDDHGSKITEDKLIEAAQTYSRGEVPAPCRELAWSNFSARYNDYSVWLNFVIHPLATVYAFYCSISELLSLNVLFPFLYAIMPQLQVICLFLMLPNIKIADFFPLFPPMLYYFSLTIMISATCQILCHKRDFRQFRSWSNLFIQYSHGSFVPTRSEMQHGKKIIRTYLWFFLAFFFHLSVPIFSHFQPMHHSECAVVAFIFTFLLLNSFSISGPRYSSKMYGVDVLSLLSFMLYVIAKYPYKTDSVVNLGWRFVDIHFPTFMTYIIGTSIDFCSNFCWLFYILIIPVIIKMAARTNWSGIYTDVVPHCVILAWWQLTLLYSQGATWYGLTRSAFTLAGCFMFLPLLCVFIITLPICAAVEFFKMGENYIVNSVFTVCTVTLTLIALYTNRRRSLIAKFCLALEVIIVVLAVAFRKDSTTINVTTVEFSTLEWDDFLKYCSRDNVNHGNGIDSQLECSTVIGAEIDWKGYVKDIEISKIDNPILYFTSGLYSEIAAFIHCLVGEKYVICENNDVCKKFTNTCHVNNWNRYEYNVIVDIDKSSGLWRTSDSTSLKLVAGNEFRNFTHRLVADDYIWFKGILTGESNGLLSSELPSVKLFGAGCLLCSGEIDAQTVEFVTITYEQVVRTLNFISNFIFLPVR